MKFIVAIAFALVISAAMARPATADSNRINIKYDSKSEQTINNRTLGVRYLYDYAQEIGDIWIAWDDGEDPLEDGAGHTDCWQATKISTGNRTYECGVFLDEQSRF